VISPAGVRNGGGSGLRLRNRHPENSYLATLELGQKMPYFNL